MIKYRILTQPFHFNKYLIGCLLLCLCSYWTKAQDVPRRANHWYFGQGYGLDFSSGKAVPDFDSAIRTYEASTSMSDKDGELLFYTNAGGRLGDPIQGYIWNRLHEPMDGGDLGSEKGGGYSASQGCVTFKKPGNNDLYCLFTVDEFETMGVPNNPFPLGKGLSYFEIDMSANGGLGAVSLSDQKLLTPSFEFLSATAHGNCQDYWVVALSGHFMTQSDPAALDSMYVFLVNENGPQAPLIFPLPSGNEREEDEYGLIRISPDGRYIQCGRYLYEFDKWTGEVEVERDLYITYLSSQTTHWCFSPNARFLYRLKGERIMDQPVLNIAQLDLRASDPANAVKILGAKSYDPVAVFGTPQIGPDGRIYMPVQSPASSAVTKLTIIDQPNKKGVAANVLFDQLILDKTDDNSRFLRLGNYTDHLFYYNPTIDVALGMDTILDCESPFLRLEGPLGMDCYAWSDGSNEAFLEIDEAGTYILEVRQGCEMGIDTIEVRLDLASIAFDLGADTTLCEGTGLLLEPGGGASQLTWQDGSEGQVYQVKEAGTYLARAGKGACLFEDSIVVEYRPLPVLEMGGDTILCEGESIRLPRQLDFVDQVLWGDGSTDRFREIQTAGSYQLMGQNECGERTDSIQIEVDPCNLPICDIYIPNVFSPNQDGYNDRFQTYSPCELDEFRLRIFNRWGDLLFESQSREETWDGRFKGKAVGAGVYAWMLEYRQTGNPKRKVISGDLSLIR